MKTLDALAKIVRYWAEIPEFSANHNTERERERERERFNDLVSKSEKITITERVWSICVKVWMYWIYSNERMCAKKKKLKKSYNIFIVLSYQLTPSPHELIRNSALFVKFSKYVNEINSSFATFSFFIRNVIYWKGFYYWLSGMINKRVW